MAKDVSVVFKASDNLTNSIQSMRKSVDGLSKDVTEYRKIQSEAFDRKVEVKFEIDKAKRELKDLEKAVKDNAEGSEKAFKDKARALENLQEEYKRLGKVAQEASKAEKSLQDDIGKTSNAQKTMAQDMVGNSTLSKLAGAGLGAMMGGALQNGINQSITSMFGQNTGSAISGVLGGALSGAAIGSIAGPIGAAVGAAVGGLTGSINALVDKQQREDDAFRTEVDRIYNDVLQSQQESLQSGIGLAGKREQDMISYSTILGGDDNANRFLNDIQQFSAKTPFEMNDLLNTSKVMLSYGYKQDEIIPLMTKIGDAGSALGIDSQNQAVVATALGRMKSSGKASLEYINQLSERAIPAIDYLAEALGKTNKQIYEMISKGAIDGVKASQIIVDAMGEQFEGNMAKQSATYEGLVSSLNDTWAQMDQAMGRGYTEKRKEGMQAELRVMSGDLKAQLEEAYSLMGEFEASLENKKQQELVSALNLATRTTEFAEAQAAGDGVKMGEIFSKAKVDAEIKYQDSEGMQKRRDSELSMVQGIQADVAINGAYLDFGQKMAEQFSKGYAGVIEDIKKTNSLALDEINSVIKEKGSWMQKAQVQSTVPNMSSQAYNPNNRTPTGHATGLERVPYDGYPAMLHEGERVLTKVEARQQDNQSGGIHIGKLADSVIIREEADIDRVVSELYSKFKKYAVNIA